MRYRVQVVRIGAIALVAVSFALGFFVRGCGGPVENAVSRQHESEEAGLWTCSMHPQIQLPKPGKCPICGMDLIPVTTSSQDSGGGLRTYTTSESALALMKLQTAPVERKFVTAEVRLVGKIEYDETRLAYISAWVPGRLDRLYVDYTGVSVNKGEHLVYMYSPEVLTAQEELRRASRALETMRAEAPDTLRTTARATLDAAREKLRRWGLTDDQIKEAEKQGTASDHITIYSPIGGTVIERNGREGMYVETGTPIYTIADLSRVWVMLDAYESDLPWIHYGQSVEFATDAIPGEVFEGKIAFIEPTVNPMTRTIKVRVNVPNEDGLLKPEMFVRGIVRSQVATGGRVMDPELAGKWICPMHPEIIKPAAGNCDICGMDLVRAEKLGYVPADATEADKPLVIPATAPLITGKRAIVYVQKMDAATPTFEGREVLLGPRAGDFYMVRSGLSEGERVVTNGNFNIDSALQILAKPSMMTPDVGIGSGHEHGEQARHDPSIAAVHDAFQALTLLDAQAAAGTFATALANVESAIGSADTAPRDNKETAAWNEFSMRLKNDIAQLRDTKSAGNRTAALHSMRATMGLLSTRFNLESGLQARAAAPSAFRSQLAKLLDDYAAVQSALADDRASEAKLAADRMRATLEALDTQSLDTVSSEDWKTSFQPELKKTLQDLTKVGDVDETRLPFKALSSALTRALASVGMPDGLTLYIIHCPMADNNAGADWLQRDRAIRNPYMGKAMLECGSVTGQLTGPDAEVRESQHTDRPAHEGHAP